MDHATLAAAMMVAKARTTGAVSDWLDEHVDPETGYVIDDTLLIEGAAADAKATGEAIAAAAAAVEADIPAVDATLANTGESADAKATGDAIAAAIAEIPNVDDTLSVAGDAADAKATGDRLTAAETNLGDLAEVEGESTELAAKEAESETLPEGFSVTPGYLRNMTVSNPGNLSGTGSEEHNCFYFQAEEDMDIWLDMPFGLSQQIAVFSGAPYGNAALVGSVYASNTSEYPLPTVQNPLHVEAEQYVAFSYFNSNTALENITWTLYTVADGDGFVLP